MRMCNQLNSSGMSKKHAFRNQKVTELLVCPEPFHLKSCEQKGSSTHRGRILTQLKHCNDKHYYHEGCGKVILFLYDFIFKPPEYPHSKISCPLCCSFSGCFYVWHFSSEFSWYSAVPLHIPWTSFLQFWCLLRHHISYRSKVKSLSSDPTLL